MRLADAQALEPSLKVHEACPAEDLAALAQLADWCSHYSPWTAPEITGEAGESGYGIWLDVTGCAHLFGDEEALLVDLTSRLNEFGFRSRAAVADTPGAAWAAVRYGLGDGETVFVSKAGRVRDLLRRLPVAALRFSPEICAGLDRLGLRQAGDLFDLPRGPLVARFGDILIRRVDQALGRQPEPISPQNPPPQYRARLSFAEPIGRLEDIEEACRHLLKTLSRQLETAGRGVRRLEIGFYRVDGSLVRIGIGTSRPTRNSSHLFHLLKERFVSVDAGFGIEAVVAGVLRTDPLTADQLSLSEVSHRAFKRSDVAADSVPALADRLANRLGQANVRRIRPRDRHLPEQAMHDVPYAGREAEAFSDQWFINRSRPLSLFTRPEPIQVVAAVPDDPPSLFRWHKIVHHIVASEGPERINPPWWSKEKPRNHDEVLLRDYYRVEDQSGDRFWVFRSGAYRDSSSDRSKANWYLHGLFA